MSEPEASESRGGAPGGRRPTKRESTAADGDRNRCKACGFRWHPAGIDRATACPRCGSEEIAFSWTERWPAYAGCVAVGAFVVMAVVSAVKIGLAWRGH